ncbi:MAG: hypothetical protein GKR97_10150 [Rhizobiaceae bacterium]|nr:hypothetical protein [Rhizobiaceae bacterium]
MPVQNFSGLSSRTNEGYKFGGTFALGTTPTLLDNTEARRVKWFIENMVFRSAFEINVGTPATNQFLADFSNGEAVKWRLDLQTALRYDREPRLGANLDLRGHDILFRELSRLVQWGANGFQFHPQNYPANTDDDLRVILKFFAWDSDNPYHVGFKTASASDLAGSGSLDADNGIVWTLPHEDGTSGQVLQTDGSRILSWVDGGSGQNFGIISVAGQSDVEADQSKDTLTLIAGTGISLTTDAAADSVTITNTDYGGGTLTVTEQDGSPSVSNVTTIKFDNGSVTDDGSGVVSVSGGGPNVGDGSTTVTSPYFIKFSDDCVSETPTGVARVLTGRPIKLYSSGNGVIVGTEVHTYTGATANSEDYHFYAADGMKLSQIGVTGSEALQLEVLKTEFSADTGVVEWRCGDRWMFVGGSGITTSTDPTSYPYGMTIAVEDDVCRSINGIAVGNSPSTGPNDFEISGGNGISVSNGTGSEIIVAAEVSNIVAGTNISVSQDGSEFTITNDKSAIVKSVDPDPDAYVAVYCDESPEVRFNDVLTIDNISEHEIETKLCAEYVHSCEEDTIKVIGHAASDPCLVGFVVDGDSLLLKFAHAMPLPESVNVHLSGIRKGFDGKRHQPKTLEQAKQNDAFWGSAYSK